MYPISSTGSFLIKLFLAFVISYVTYEIMKRICSYIWVVKCISKIPGPPTRFPFGNVLPFLGASSKDFLEIGHDLIGQLRVPNESISRIWIFHIPVVVIVKAEAAEKLLKSNSELQKSTLYDVARPWLGDGLLMSSGKKWQLHRKIITPSFHFKTLENFLSIFNEHSKTLVEILTENARRGDVEIYPLLTLCTLDIICATAMGKCINAQKNPQCEYVKAVRTLNDINLYRSIKPWLQLPWIYYFTSMRKEDEKCLKIVHSFTEKIIEERLQHFNAKLRTKEVGSDSELNFGFRNRVAFLDGLLLASNNGQKSLSFKELCDEVNTFMFEGHDTTATALIWSLIILGHNPCIQERAFEEINQICGSAEVPFTLTEINQLKYLEAVIKETLRLYPPLPAYGRLLANDLELGGYLIPKGVEVFVYPHHVHRDLDYYDDPDEFRPERFLNDNEKYRHNFSFVPFSAGSRNCIGQRFAMMEEKVVLGHIIRRFKFECVTKLEDIKPSILIVANPISKVDFVLQRR